MTLFLEDSLLGSHLIVLFSIISAIHSQSEKQKMYSA